MDVIEALAHLIEDTDRVVASSVNEMDGMVMVNLYALQDAAESLIAAQKALDWYRDREAEAAA